MADSNFNLKRNEILVRAYKRVGIIRPGTQIMTAAQLQDGIKILNLILRECDAKGTQSSKHLWALKENYLFLKAGGMVYGEADGLATDIQDLQTIFYSNSGGAESAVELVTSNGYESIYDKDQTGTPLKAYLKMDKDLHCQLLFIWPHPTGVAAPSEVVGSDGLNYSCVTPHTSALENRPISGQSYRLFWQPWGTAGTTWVTETSYTAGETMRYMHKRPLYDFDNAADNPDFPPQWTRYLWLRTAYDLSGDYHISEEERKTLMQEYLTAEADIFPSTQPAETDYHNKHIYF